MATRRKGAKRSATKKKVVKARPKSKPEPRASAPAEESREVHYTDLRKVLLANALKRLR